MAFPIAMIPALFQAGVGIAQQMKSKDLADRTQRPEYKTPDELIAAVGLSKSQFADPRFAGQAQLEAQVGQNLSQALEVAQSRGSGMQQVAAIAAAGNQASQDIAAEQAKQQRSDLMDYQNMLKILAQSRDTEFQMNKFAPYSDQYNEAREMKGAGQQNLFSALDSLAAITGRFSNTASNQPDTNALISQANQSNQVTQNRQYADVLLAKQMQQWAQMAQSAQNASNVIYGSVK